MKFPTLKQNNTTRQIIDEFRGYNHNLRIGDNEFYDMKNLSSDNYPVLSPRKKREIARAGGMNYVVGIIAKNSLGYVVGSEFFLDGVGRTQGLKISEKSDLKNTEIVPMGAYVIIIAKDADGNVVDKKWVNTQTVELNTNYLTDFGDIDAMYESEEGQTVSIRLCKTNGENYENVNFSLSIPVNPTNGAIWIDPATGARKLKQYSEATGSWIDLPTVSFKITAPGIGTKFEEDDGITISGVTTEYASTLNTAAVIAKKDNDSIIVTGIEYVDYASPNNEDQTTPIKVSRAMPLMDFVTEAGNRLWGCRYGLNATGEMVNEIYCSKLGDFKNWNYFMGASMDSYVASVGTDGAFTGAITYQGYPIFFKEGYMHKVYGNAPSNFQVQTTACRGVQQGSRKSLAIVNDTLFYKSKNSVCSYDGSLPSERSYALGDVAYSSAVAGAYGNKYYISMKDSAELYHLFVFDTVKSLWHKEDNTRVDAFCSSQGNLYFIEHGKEDLYCVGANESADARPVEWMAETGLIGTDSPYKKYVSRLNVRMSIEAGTQVSVYLQYDSGGAWERVLFMTGTKTRSFTMPIRPKRCDHLRMRVVGVGNASIYSITKTIEEGSDFA